MTEPSFASALLENPEFVTLLSSFYEHGPEDFLGEMALKASSHRSSWRIRNPKQWFRSVSKNWAHNKNRSNRTREMHERAAARPDYDVATVDLVQRREIQDAVAAAVAELPQDLHRVISIRFFDGLTREQTAHQLGVSPSQVHRLTAKAFVRLRIQLEPYSEASRFEWLPFLAKLHAQAQAARKGTVVRRTIKAAHSYHLLAIVAVATTVALSAPWWAEALFGTDGGPAARTSARVRSRSHQPRESDNTGTALQVTYVSSRTPTPGAELVPEEVPVPARPLTGTWQLEPLPRGPGPRMAGALAPLGDGRFIYFGGEQSTSFEFPGLLAETWILEDGAWRKLECEVSPCPRFAHSMARNPGGGVVLFGGITLQQGGHIALGDTWVFRDGVWREVPPKYGPPARRQAMLRYDPGRDVTVMFGGGLGLFEANALADTWEWDGQYWGGIRSSETPGARMGGAHFFDVQAQAIVLFGGFNLDQPLGDMWQYQKEGWERISYKGDIAPRALAAAAYVPDRRLALISGGLDGWPKAKTYGDTWSWQRTGPLSGAWSLAADETASSRYAYNHVMGVASGVVFQLGGCSGTRLQDPHLVPGMATFATDE